MEYGASAGALCYARHSLPDSQCPPETRVLVLQCNGPSREYFLFTKINSPSRKRQFRGRGVGAPAPKGSFCLQSIFCAAVFCPRAITVTVSGCGKRSEGETLKEARKSG